MNRHINKRQSGFTLIEIAIVMVIIGLLLGGVLKGQAMINSAKVRSLNNKMDGITAAWFAFQDRYRAIPGDMSNIQATAQIGTVTGGGNANGQVNTNAEHRFVFNHLIVAGFMTGAQTAATNPGNVVTCPTTVCPDNGFGLGILLTYFDNSNVGGPSHELVTGGQIPVSIVAELDRKIDDSQANQGSVRVATATAACATAAAYNIAANSSNCALVSRSL